MHTKQQQLWHLWCMWDLLDLKNRGQPTPDRWFLQWCYALWLKVINSRHSRPRGGVCFYYKDNLPIKRRTDLELLGETICAEISLNRKKIIYILSYSSHSQNSAEFKMYIQQLQNIYPKACSENPASIILCGDFNARSPLLWSGERTELPEGRDLADFFTLNSLEQMVKDATHEPNSTT